ncbi:MAG: hypothetical protein HQK77_20905 [Desulfobacterales bacterium]|nr:hypothetical protein [Desulfobacterales bacterium]
MMIFSKLSDIPKITSKKAALRQYRLKNGLYLINGIVKCFLRITFANDIVFLESLSKQNTLFYKA